jgi:hypothetical protein
VNSCGVLFGEAVASLAQLPALRRRQRRSFAGRCGLSALCGQGADLQLDTLLQPKDVVRRGRLLSEQFHC